MKGGYKIITLPLDEDLASRARDILKVMEETAVEIVFYRYLGIDTLPGFIWANEKWRFLLYFPILCDD